MVTTKVNARDLREVNRAFRQIDKKLATDLGGEVKAAAEPVAADARQKVTRYRGASVSTIRARRSGLRVFVEQGARKVTGKRGDFGALQMRTVLIPALEENEAEVVARIEMTLDKYAAASGF